MTGIRECILYRDFEQGELLEKMTMLMEDISHPKVLYGKDGEYFACIHQLVEMAGTYGFAGNLWHDYLTYLLVNHENAFSTACEIVGPVEGTINAFAMHDFEIFKQLYDFDLKELEKIVMIRHLDGFYRLDHAVTATQKTILDAFGLSEGSVRNQAKEIGKTLQDRTDKD